jgi:hypothetical protein
MQFYMLGAPGRIGAMTLRRQSDNDALRPLAFLTGAASLMLGFVVAAAAQIPATLNGPPVQVVPMYSEPGVPTVTVTPGTLNPFAGADGLVGSGGNGEAGGTGDGGGVGGAGSGTGSGSGSSGGSSEPLNTMLATSWGASAVAYAQELGVNPSALAATCVLESGCQNIGGAGSITGAFQMLGSTYTAMINAAIAANPSLASQIVPGLAGQSDPATQSIAAAEYLLQGAQALQANNISNPTVLAVRGYYNFGPAAGVQIANASDSQSMSSILSSYYTPQQIANNGITPGETVGQWRGAVSAQIGSAANQTVRM